MKTSLILASTRPYQFECKLSCLTSKPSFIFAAKRYSLVDCKVCDLLPQFTTIASSSAPLTSVRWVSAVRCDHIGRFIALWATFQLFCPNLRHFKSIFKIVKIFHFSSEIICGQLLPTFWWLFTGHTGAVSLFLGHRKHSYRHLVTFYWSHWCRFPLFGPSQLLLR